MARIVPNSLSASIYERVDAAIAAADDPENAAIGREFYYEELLNFFDDYGYIPEFALAKRGAAQ